MVSSVIVSADYDLPSIAAAAGNRSEPGRWYDGGRLYVEGVTQEALDSALANYDHSAVVRTARLAAVAHRRWKKETAGVVWLNHGISTEREARSLLDQERMAVLVGDRVDGEPWKCKDLATGEMVFWPRTNQEMNDMASAVRRYVLACFAREDALIAEVAAGTYTDSMIDEGWPSPLLA